MKKKLAKYSKMEIVAPLSAHSLSRECKRKNNAGLAQLVEQLICNQ